MSNRRNGFHRTLFVTAILLAMVPGTVVTAGKNTDNGQEFRWEDAVGDVAHLPYNRRFTDSLKIAHKVSWPAASLRRITNRDLFWGETLVYDIGWGPFKAGYIILTADPDTAHKTVRLGAKALSNSFVDRFYRMRDYVISTVDETGLYPLFFEQHLREGKKFRSDGWILYDQARGKILVKERKLKTFDAPAFVNDYLSVLYNVRTMSFAPGDTFSLPLYAERKVHALYFACRERRLLRIGSAEVSCLVVEPKLVTEKGAFNKKDKLEVWLTDDELKRPVLIKSKIKVGSITAKLIDRGTATDRKATPSSPASATPRDSASFVREISPAIIDSAASVIDTAGTPITTPDTAH